MNKIKFIIGGMIMSLIGIGGMCLSNSSESSAATTELYVASAELEVDENYISPEELIIVNSRLTDEAFKAICQANPEGLDEAGKVLGEADRSEYIRFFVENGYISRSTLGL